MLSGWSCLFFSYEMVETAARNPATSTCYRPLNRTAKLVVVPVFLAQLFFFTYVGLHRLVNGDEGFYLMAARLISEQALSRFLVFADAIDPYVYALWMRLTHQSWISARVLAALMTALLGTLIYAHVYRLTRALLRAQVLPFVFASTTLIFGYFSLIAPHWLANLLIFSAYLLVSKVPASSNKSLAFAGLLFGLTVDTRSYLVLVGPLFIWWICHCSARSLWLRFSIAFVGLPGGDAASSVPVCPVTRGFLFGNLEYHSLRSGSGLVGIGNRSFHRTAVSHRRTSGQRNPG